MRTNPFLPPNAGNDAGTSADRDQRDAGRRSPLHLPRLRWPFDRTPLAAQGDALAFDAVIARVQREEAFGRRLDRALQAMILALTLPGLYLVGDLDPAARWWGYVISLAAQPFWLAATWRARQPAMFVVAIFFSALWVRAIAVNY